MTKAVTIQGQQKWEYCLETRKTETALLLTINDLGEHGWELAEVLYYKDLKGVMSWTAFLKRPSVGQAAKPGQQAAAAATPDRAGAALQGFDLDGEDFNLRAEEPEPAESEAPRAAPQSAPVGAAKPT